MGNIKSFGLLVSVLAALYTSSNNSYAEEKPKAPVVEELAELTSEIFECKIINGQQSYVSVTEFEKSQQQDYTICCFDISCLEWNEELDGKQVCNKQIYDLKVVIDTKHLQDIEIEKDSRFGAELRLVYHHDLNQNAKRFGEYYSRYKLPFSSAKKLEKLLKQYMKLEEK